jgi:hypothetical protein
MVKKDLSNINFSHSPKTIIPVFQHSNIPSVNEMNYVRLHFTNPHNQTQSEKLVGSDHGIWE